MMRVKEGFMKRLFALAAALMFTLPLFGQSAGPGAVQSLADLDRESAALAAQVRQYRAAAGATLEIGPFSTGGTEPALGNYWRQNLVNQLAGSGFTVLAPGGAVRGSLLLSGEIILMGRTVRIYTRLVDRSNAAVLAAWTSDLERSPFIDGLVLSAGGGSGGGGSGGTALPDIYEVDSRENPVEITAGGDEVQRTIHSRDDRDWFVIRPEENGLYIMETSGSMDTMMELYEGSRRLAENDDDDDGESDNALISHLLEGGKSYLVMIKGYGSATGSYGFSVWNRRQGAVVSVEAESFTEASISSGEENQYRFTLDEEAFVIIQTRGNLDTMMSLENDEGVLATDDDSGDRDNARIRRRLPPGAYLVRVWGYDRGTAGPYTLELSRTTYAGDSYENDNTMETAKPIALGETQRHTFSHSDDEDWVVFDAAASGYYRISARGETDIDLDTELFLYDEGGDLVSYDDDSEGYSSLIRHHLEPGRYYIRVRCLDREPPDAYLLRVGLE